MLYLNSAPFVNLKTVPDLTLTSVVFELVKTSLINLLLLYHLTLTSVVFEFLFPPSLCHTVSI